MLCSPWRAQAVGTVPTSMQYTCGIAKFPTAVQAENCFYQAWISAYQKTSCGFNQWTWVELSGALNGYVPFSPICGYGHVLPVVLAKLFACPEHSTGGAVCTCDNGYKPNTTNTSCISECPVEQLAPIATDVQPYEDGLVDMDNETASTRDGAACVVRQARANIPRVGAFITSGYRPPAYQTHIREVYDKWQLLKDNNDLVCADLKHLVELEFDHHKPFAHQPGVTSRHSTGLAVDISLTNYMFADLIAASCVIAGGGTMSRPVANDRSHFESPR